MFAFLNWFIFSSEFLASSRLLKLGLFCAYLSVFSSNISSSQLIFLRIHCRLVCILSGEVEEVSAPLQEGISSVLRRSSSPQNLGVFSNLRFSKIKNCCITASPYDVIVFHVLYILSWNKDNIRSINVANVFLIVDFINSELFCACTRNITKCIFGVSDFTYLMWRFFWKRWTNKIQVKGVKFILKCDIQHWCYEGSISLS